MRAAALPTPGIAQAVEYPQRFHLPGQKWDLLEGFSFLSISLAGFLGGPGEQAGSSWSGANLAWVKQQSFVHFNAHIHPSRAETAA